MRINGLALLVDSAVEAVSHPVLQRYRKAIVLGSLREDVVYIPIVGTVFEHWSLSHFYKPPLPGGFIPLLWPGARRKATRYFRAAVRKHRAGNTAAGFVTLGRVAHLLSDMACPVHVHRRPHDRDTFEWYVESHCDELRKLSVPDIPSAESAAQLIERMARFTAQFPADATQFPLGRWLKKRGLLRAIPKPEIARHAHAIIPMATAHMTNLFRLYLDRIDDR